MVDVLGPSVLDKNIDIEQDLPFQYRQWRLERFGQVLIDASSSPRFSASLGIALFPPRPSGPQTDAFRFTMIVSLALKATAMCW